jgi:hypothetical protein
VVAELFHAGGRADDRTDRHDETTGLFSFFFELAKKNRCSCHPTSLIHRFYIREVSCLLRGRNCFFKYDFR